MHKALPAQSAIVEFTGKNRPGVSNKGPTPKPYWIIEAFAQFPGERYPQAFEIFTFDQSVVKPEGFYEVPAVYTRKEGRLALDLDYAAARPLPAQTARAS